MQENHNMVITNINNTDVADQNTDITNIQDTNVMDIDITEIKVDIPNEPNEQGDDDISSKFSNPITKSFISETRLIEKDLDEINSNISNIQNTQTQISISTSKKQEATLISYRDSIMDSTRSKLNEAKIRIKSLEIQDLRINRSSATSEDVELRKQRIVHLREKFISCLQTYRNIEGAYMKQQKERLSRQYRIVYPDANDDEIEEYLRYPTDQPVFHSRRSITDSKHVLDEVNKRHHDIKKIEKTISELVDLFEEIRFQVELKDDIIIQINDDVNAVEMTTRVVVNEVEKAQELAKDTRKKKWTLLLIILIIIIIILIILAIAHII